MARTRTLYFVLCGCALVGFLCVVLSTTSGVGLTADSITYVDAARSLVNGRGYSLPVGNGIYDQVKTYPPLYSTSLALASLGLVDPVVAARWLQALLFFSCVLLAGGLLWAGTGDLWTTALGAFTLATAPGLLSVFSTAWSEGLFLVLSLGATALVAAHLHQPRSGSLVGAAVLAGLSAICRYQGVAVLGALALTLVTTRSPRRWRDGLSFGALASLPLGSLLAWNRFVGGVATGRDFVLHTISLKKLLGVGETVGNWVLPWPAMGAPVLAIAVVLLGSAWIGIRRHRPDPHPLRPLILRALAWLVTITVALLGLTLMIWDAAVPLNDRILSSLFVFGLVALALLAHRVVTDPMTSRRTRGVLLVGTLLLGGVSWVRGGFDTLAAARDGVPDYGTRAWKSSPLMARVAFLPKGTIIHSNAADAIRILLGRFAYDLPAHTLAHSLVANPQYEDAMRRVAQDLEHGAVIAYFDAVSWRWWIPLVPDLIDEFDLAPFQTEEDGMLLGLREH